MLFSAWHRPLHEVLGTDPARCGVDVPGLRGVPVDREIVQLCTLPAVLDGAAIARSAALVEGLVERCRTVAELRMPTGRARQDRRTLVAWGWGGW